MPLSLGGTSELKILLSLKDKASAKLKTFSKDFKGMATKMAKVAAIAGAALAVGIGVKAIKSAADFGKAMGNVSTLVDTNTESMRRMSKEVLNMSKRLPVGIDELTSALYDVRSAGISASDAMNVLETSAMLGVAGLSTTKDAANLLTTAINAFGLQSRDSVEVADILFKTVKAGKTTVAELSQAFGKMAGNAKAAGISFEDVQAATAALTALTGKTSESQNALSQVFLELTVQGGKLDKGLQKNRSSLMKLNEMIGEEGLVGGMKTMQEHLGLSATQFKNLFSSAEGGTVVFQLLTDAYDKNNESLQEMKSGSIELTAAFEKQRKEAWAQLQLFQNELGIVMIDFGTKVIPYVISGLHLLLKAINYTSTGWKLFTLSIEEVGASMMHFINTLKDDEKEMEIWKQVLEEIDEEQVQVLLGFEEMSEELEILKEGAKITSKETQDFGKALEEAGKTAENAFKKAVKGIIEIRDEIRKTYQEIEDNAKAYTEKIEGLEADKGKKIVDLIADAEKEIISLGNERVQALADGQMDEARNLGYRISEKQRMIERFYSEYSELEDELAERKEYLAMNEMEKIEFDYRRKKAMAQKEYLEAEIIRMKKLTALIKEHKTAMEWIGKEKEAAIQAEVEKEKTFREKLKEKTEGLKSWVEEQKIIYGNYVSSVNRILGSLFSPIPVSGSIKGSRQFGGTIPETGPYLLHKGETVIPSNKSGGGITINISGNTFMADQEGAEAIGDLIIERLKTQMRFMT